MQLATIKENTRPIVKKIKEVTITSADEMESATELLSTSNLQMDLIIAHEDKEVKPLKEELKAKQAEWAPMKKVLKAGIEKLREAMGVYQTAETKRVQAEEAKIAKRMVKGTLKTETAVRKMSEVVKPEAKVETMVGSISFRTDKKLHIIDETLIPREYLIIDEKKLLNALKAGIEVKGAEIQEVQTPINRR